MRWRVPSHSILRKCFYNPTVASLVYFFSAPSFAPRKMASDAIKCQYPASDNMHCRRTYKCPWTFCQQEEATPPSRESVADVSQLAVSNSQDMQDDMVCLTASPAGSEEGRVDNENPGAVDKRRPPAMRRRSESADGSAPLNLNEAGGRAAAIQGPELGVQVIDEGTTKQLVLTTTTGHRPAGAFNHDAPQEPAKTFANSPAPRFVHGRRKSNGVIDPDDEIARSIAFRERFSAVLLGEQDIDPPFTGVDGISPAATKSKTPYDVPRPRSVEHDEHAPAFQQREGHSTSLSPRVVSSPQVDRYASGEQRPPPPTPPIPGSVDGNISDLLRPSEIISPSLPECVQEQVSFHDVLPSGYGQQSLRTVSFRREDCSRTIPTSQTMPVVSHEGTTRSTSEHTDSLTAVQTGNRGQSYERQEPRQQDMQVCVDFPDGAGGDAKQSVLGSRDQADPGLEKDSAKGETPFGDSEADSKGPLLHFRSDFTRQLADGNRPAIFFLRSNEGLAVTRVEGSGRLLVTLRVEAGEGVLVDDAIVYDSAADFAHSATLVSHLVVPAVCAFHVAKVPIYHLQNTHEAHDHKQNLREACQGEKFTDVTTVETKITPVIVNQFSAL